jgi:hypothetical protein
MASARVASRTARASWVVIRAASEGVVETASELPAIAESGERVGAVLVGVVFLVEEVGGVER